MDGTDNFPTIILEAHGRSVNNLADLLLESVRDK